MTSEQKGVDVLAVMLADANCAYMDRVETGPALASRARESSEKARAIIADLIDSHARLLALCRSCGLPKVADDLAPLAEARRIIAAIDNKAQP